MKTKEKIETLRVALIKAVAEAKKFTNVEDGGTSNFDNPIINLYGWKDTEVREAFLLTGLRPYKEKDSFYTILGVCTNGQGFRRTAMAEAFRDSLRASGYTAYVEYRMD